MDINTEIFNNFIRFYKKIKGTDYNFLKRANDDTLINEEEQIFFDLLKEYQYREKTNSEYNDIYTELLKNNHLELIIKDTEIEEKYYSYSLISLLYLVSQKGIKNWNIEYKK